jgi:hypothetical protein
MLALWIEDHASIGLSGPGSAGRQSFYGFIILVVDGAPVSCGTFRSWGERVAKKVFDCDKMKWLIWPLLEG